MRRFVAVFGFVGLLGLSVTAQPVVVRGDLLVSSTSYSGPFDDQPTGSIRVYSRNGALKGTLIELPGRTARDLFERDGIIYLASFSDDDPDAILRIDLAGNLIAPFTTDVERIGYISPGPNGGLLAQNNSGEVYQFAADGSLVRFRDFAEDPPAHGGIELAADDCTVYWVVLGRLARWNACANSSAAFVTPASSYTFRALRLLPDGTFLVTVFGPEILHLAASGSVIRQYDNVTFGNGLALDIDGPSFWTHTGCRPIRVDIATGAILTTGECVSGNGSEFVAVVGEPRAGLPSSHIDATVPTLSQTMLALLALAFAATAIVKLRIQ